MEKFNGHDSYEHWNVAAWIDNDEGLYSLAHDCARVNIYVSRAADMFIDCLSELGVTHTPDGVDFTQETVEAYFEALEL